MRVPPILVIPRFPIESLGFFRMSPFPTFEGAPTKKKFIQYPPTQVKNFKFHPSVIHVCQNRSRAINRFGFSPADVHFTPLVPNIWAPPHMRGPGKAPNLALASPCLNHTLAHVSSGGEFAPGKRISPHIKNFGSNFFPTLGPTNGNDVGTLPYPNGPTLAPPHREKPSMGTPSPIYARSIPKRSLGTGSFSLIYGWP